MKSFLRNLLWRLLGDPERHGRAGARRRADEGSRRIRELERAELVRTTMSWIEQATLAAAPLVSVVLPTRNRRALLPRAVASVRAQSYPRWELLIVDDASSDDTPPWLASLDDPAIRVLRGAGAGVCAARNLALAQARGSLIAYLDDDNTMHPHWLRSVAWAFERQAAEVLYGAIVIDDDARTRPEGRGGTARLHFPAYDHHALALDNIADIGCIAHRAGLPEAHFDEALREMGDWDLFLRLTRDAPPHALPAIACFYATDAPERLSFGPTHAADLARVRERNRRA